MGNDEVNRRWCEELETRLGFVFDDDELLRVALTHSSFANENAEEGLQNSERLEFLGDAVLDLAVAHLLMDRYSDAKEGQLTQARSAVVSEPTLAEAAREVDLGRWLRLGRGEEQTGGRNKSSLLADGYEAVMAAIYLDGGFGKVLEVIRTLLGGRVDRAMRGVRSHDPKSRVQEYLQARHKTRPEYVLTAEHGPEHEKRFNVALFVWGREVSSGSGFSKKDAEQDAAGYLLERVEENPSFLDDFEKK